MEFRGVSQGFIGVSCFFFEKRELWAWLIFKRSILQDPWLSFCTRIPGIMI